MSYYAYRSSNRTNKQRNQRKTGNRGRGQYIDPAKFVKPANPTKQESYEAKHTFDDFAVTPLIKTNLANRGYKTPSPIQDQTILPALSGEDIIGIASTGTGKTAAFAIPVLNRLIEDKSSAAIIIAPTRELAQQIEVECKHIAKGSGLFGAVLIGGTNMGGQLRDLKSSPRVIIGTPGRIKDHIERGSLQLSNFNMVVLDEVDRMLDMGFVNDVTYILSQASPRRQSLFFSATIDNKVRSLIDQFCDNPITVSLKASSASENVHQNVVRYNGTHEKISKLHDTLITENTVKAIVFDETQRNVDRLCKELVERGFKVDSIHGGKTQGQRQRALNRFKKNEVTVLVATDVAARGIDIADISHVINYSVPQTYDDYIHRIGRAGRAGKVGHALTFVSH